MMKYVPHTGTANIRINTDKSISKPIYKSKYKAGIPISITSSLVAQRIGVEGEILINKNNKSVY